MTMIKILFIPWGQYLNFETKEDISKYTVDYSKSVYFGYAHGSPEDFIECICRMPRNTCLVQLYNKLPGRLSVDEFEIVRS